MAGALVTATLIALSCKHEPPVDPLAGLNGGNGGGGGWVPPPDTTEVGVTCDPDTVYFQQAVLPLVVSFCATSGCHDAITHRDGVRLYDFSHIHNYVHAGNPNGSELIQVLSDGMPPSNHPQMTTAQENLIRTWIQQGALNNGCEPTACDTANVTYGNTIAPLFANMCNGCHGGSSPDGNIDLTTYSGAHAVAANGHLAGALQHQSGFSAMPPVGSGLSQCHIDQVLQWIGQGAPNN